VDGEQVAPGPVSLRLEGTTDPDGHALRYLVEVFDAPDASLAPTAQSWLTLADGEAAGEVIFEAPAEPRAWYWRATAEDALGLRGQPAGLEEFTVLFESQNQPPPAPTLRAPIGGDLASPGLIELVLDGVEDPDGDAVTYTVWAQDPQGQEVLRQANIPHAASPRVPLESTAPGLWRWSALATDARGLDGPEATPETFLIVVDEPDMGEPDLIEPDLIEPDLIEPDADDMDLAMPDLAAPDMPEPDLIEPDADDMDLAMPDLAEPDVDDLAPTGDTGAGLEGEELGVTPAVSGDVQGGAGCGCATPARPAAPGLAGLAGLLALAWGLTRRR
jgi:hypothetical protein